MEGNDMDQPMCTVDGCNKPSRNKLSAAMCKMHYHRWYRHGDTTKVATTGDVSVFLGRRYHQRYLPGHPVAPASGRVYVHRVVLYDKIGPGPHHCHWCSTEVDWLPKCAPGELQVDHLNNDGGDNRPENLVPACRDCNTGRAMQRRADALREAGWWSSHDTIAGLSAGGRRQRVDPTPTYPWGVTPLGPPRGNRGEGLQEVRRVQNVRSRAQGVVSTQTRRKAAEE